MCREKPQEIACLMSLTMEYGQANKLIDIEDTHALAVQRMENGDTGKMKLDLSQFVQLFTGGPCTFQG